MLLFQCYNYTFHTQFAIIITNDREVEIREVVRLTARSVTVTLGIQFMGPICLMVLCCPGGGRKPLIYESAASVVTGVVYRDTTSLVVDVDHIFNQTYKSLPISNVNGLR